MNSFAPFMCCGVLKALGPPERSLSLEYSLQGGASMINTTIPDQHSVRRLQTLRCPVCHAVLPSRSKGSKQSRPRLMAADVTGCSLPENTSKSNFFEAECNGGSALASVCGPDFVPGPLWYEQGKPGVGVAFAGMGNCEGCVWGPVWGPAGCGVAARSCAGPRSGLFDVCLLWSMAGCFCWQPMMPHTWAKRLSLVQRPV